MTRYVGGATVLAGLALVLAACGEPTQPRLATLIVRVDGLPTGAQASITLTGPGGTTLTALGNETWENVRPGRYSVVAPAVRASNTLFGVETPEWTIDVVAGHRDSVVVHYLPMTGSLAVGIAVPYGVTPRVNIAGPNGFQRQLSASETLYDLEPGAYTFAAETVSARGFRYAGLNATSTIDVAPSVRPGHVTIFVVAISGALAVDVRGLPAEGGVAAQVTGPNGFARTIASSTVMGDIAPGMYVVTPATSVFEGVTYQAAGAPREITVNAGYTARSLLDFLPVGADGSVLLNHRADALTLTQVVQRADNSLPMIAGRDALLRVFAVSSVATDARPVVRARFYRSGVLVDSLTTLQPAAPTRTVVDPADTSGTYDVVVPGALVQPGLAVQVEIDPDRVLAEATRLDNVYPAAPLAIDVRDGARRAIRLVPVLQTATGLQGNVTEATKDTYVGFARRVYPVADFDADVHLPYTTSAPALDAKDTSRAWGRILSEIEALRVTEGSSSNYYGVVRVSYQSGVAGVGYIRGRSAIGWDHMPTGTGVVAHELGHNFGRYHAPGCGAGGVDPNFPYVNGGIGGLGWDAVTGKRWPITAPDLMTYCHPEWISDYTYEAVLTTLEANVSPTAAGTTLEECLVVWGRIENGVPVLEPAFTVRTRAALPARAGAHRIRGLGGAGDELFSLAFDAQEVADLPESRAFAFAVPVSRLRGRALAELRLGAPSGEARRVVPALPSPADPEVSLRRAGGDRATLRWNAARYPLAVVRDARTGQVVALARRGSADVHATRPEVEVTFSSGVGSVSRRVTITR